VFKYYCAIAQIHKGKHMKKILAVIAASVYLMSPTANAQTSITGAGATFPYPVYSKWSEAYQVKTDVQLNYQSIGSSGGIKQIKAATVDFGATDAPLKGDELTASGLVQFPTVLGGVVPIINVEGIRPGELQLTGEVLADIYLGTITQWNDAKIAALNPKTQVACRVYHSCASCRWFWYNIYLH
jgi:phosphate transport system substrate-binding protein